MDRVDVVYNVIPLEAVMAEFVGVDVVDNIINFISANPLYITAALSLTSSFSISKAITVRFPLTGNSIYPLASTDPWILLIWTEYSVIVVSSLSVKFRPQPEAFELFTNIH